MSGHKVKENCEELSMSRRGPRKGQRPNRVLLRSCSNLKGTSFLVGGAGSAGHYNREGLGPGNQIKGYVWGSFLKRSSHLRLDSIMP
jgi:hypothetical protein